jgi:hypothetical protein
MTWRGTASGCDRSDAGHGERVFVVVVVVDAMRARGVRMRVVGDVTCAAGRRVAGGRALHAQRQLRQVGSAGGAGEGLLLRKLSLFPALCGPVPITRVPCEERRTRMTVQAGGDTRVAAAFLLCERQCAKRDSAQQRQRGAVSPFPLPRASLAHVLQLRAARSTARAVRGKGDESVSGRALPRGDSCLTTAATPRPPQKARRALQRCRIAPSDRARRAASACRAEGRALARAAAPARAVGRCPRRWRPLRRRQRYTSFRLLARNAPAGTSGTETRPPRRPWSRRAPPSRPRGTQIGRKHMAQHGGTSHALQRRTHQHRT